MLKPLNQNSVNQCYINGKPMTSMDPVELKANDRIIFGVGSAFIYRNDLNVAEATREDTPENPVT